MWSVGIILSVVVFIYEKESGWRAEEQESKMSAGERAKERE